MAKSLGKTDAAAIDYATLMFKSQDDFYGDNLNTTWVDGHIASLAGAARVLLLETTILDAEGDHTRVILESNATFDYSYHGPATTPTASAVEARLAAAGYACARLDDCVGNTDEHVYDWTPGEDLALRYPRGSRRRFWACQPEASVGSTPLFVRPPPEPRRG